MLSDAAADRARGFFEAVLDRVPTPTILVEPGTARVRFANRAAHALAGGRFPQSSDAPGYERHYRVTDAAGRPLPSDRHPAVRIARGERLENEQVEWHLTGR